MPNSFNGFLISKKQLQDFSIEIRKLINFIKSKYNGQTPLYIFPAIDDAARDAAILCIATNRDSIVSASNFQIVELQANECSYC